MAVARGHGHIQLQPAVQPGIAGSPAEGAVVAVTHGQGAAGPENPPEFNQRRHRVGQMLHHLVGVHDVERGVVIGQVEQISHLEAEIGQLARRRSDLSLLHDVG